jgi:benzoyl-CoA reductase/2-hydroxyglutaryl-CoA dehydratase subunit BcrC/BadD/HgdB
MSLFEMLRDERDKVQRLRDALSDLLAMFPSLPKPDTGAEHIWNQRVAAAEAIMKLTETKHNG